MPKNVRFAAVCACALLLVVGYAVPASAAPTAWSFVDVGLQAEQGRTLLLVSGDLSEEVPLPCEAELAVPAGTQLQWIGEILDGPATQDPELPYVKTTVGGMDVYAFTLTKSRTAQIEVIASGMTSGTGETRDSAIAWTAWQDLPSVRVSQRLQAGAQIVQAADGASMQSGGGEFIYYTKTVTDAKAGDVIDLTFSYTLPAAGSPVGAGGSNTSTLVVVFIAAAALLLIAMALVLVRQKPMQGSAAPVVDDVETVWAPSAYSEPAGVDDPADEPRRRIRLVTPKSLIAASAILAVVVAVSVLGGGGAPKNGKITKFFGSTSPCSATTIRLTPNAGVDLAKQGEDIVDAFTGYDGIGDVTLTIDTSTLDVTYCESSQTDASIREIVETTGLVTITAASEAPAPATATVDQTGTKQTIAVDTSTGAFAPATVVLRADLPTEIAFGPAVGCVTEVVFADLGITQALSATPTAVALPALEPGTYTFSCALGHQAGSIIVQ